MPTNPTTPRDVVARLLYFFLDPAANEVDWSDAPSDARAMRYEQADVFVQALAGHLNEWRPIAEQAFRAGAEWAATHAEAGCDKTDKALFGENLGRFIREATDQAWTNYAASPKPPGDSA